MESARLGNDKCKKIIRKVLTRIPLVGKNFNIKRAGIHTDDLLKNVEIYNIFNTESFLKLQK